MFELIVLSALLVYFITKWVMRKNKNSPPGPYGLPIVGYYPFLGKDPYTKLRQLSEKYGEIMRINLLNEDFYFLNSLETVNEAFVKKGENFTGRPAGDRFNYTVHIYTENAVITSEGKAWQALYKFFLATLAGVGMGKTKLETRIHSISESMIKSIAAKNGEAFDVYKYLKNSITNLISSMLYSKQYDQNDREYIELNEIAHLMARGAGDSTAGFLNGSIFYILKRIERTSYEDLLEARSKFHQFFSRVLEQRIKERENDQYDDILHYYFKEMETGDSNVFNTERLIWNCVNLFIDGSETTSVTLYYALNMMARRVDVQRKVQNEIDKVLGKDRMVSYQDRHLLNYTTAVISEIQRYMCTVPIGVPRANHREDTIGGYTIPKRSIIVPNLWRLSRDKRFFKNSDNFDPENFLDENCKFVNKEASLPFSTGKRKCLGAKMAEVQIFINFVNFMQKFEWKFPNDEVPELKMIEGLVRSCMPYEICAIPR